MGELAGLLTSIESGVIPTGTLTVRKSRIRNTTRSRHQVRIAPIDDALESIQENLGVGGGNGDYAGKELNPDQYDAASGLLGPASETLDEAQAIVLGLRRAPYLSENGTRVFHDESGHEVRKPWNRSTRLPHMEKIIRLKEQVGQGLGPAKKAYERWKAGNIEAKREYVEEISQLETSASRTEKDYGKLGQAYESLQQNMKAPRGDWYASAARILGCDSGVEAILTSLESTEKILKTEVDQAISTGEGIKTRLKKEREAAAQAEYKGHLLLEDIGTDEEDSGLRGSLKTASAHTDWYKEPSGRQSTLFKGGVTIGNAESRKMIETARAVIPLEQLATSARSYELEMGRMEENLKSGNFGGVYDTSYNPSEAAEQVETAFSGITGYAKLKGHYKEQVGVSGDLQPKVQRAYDEACQDLEGQTTRYEEITRVEEWDVTSTKTAIGELVAQIEAARNFGYGNVETQEVISNHRLDELRKFQGVLESTENLLAEDRGDQGADNDLERFNTWYRKATQEINGWGFQFPESRTYVNNAREYADKVIAASSQPQETKQVDSRVAHLFEAATQTTNVEIPAEKLEQLRAWESQM